MGQLLRASSIGFSILLKADRRVHALTVSRGVTTGLALVLGPTLAARYGLVPAVWGTEIGLIVGSDRDDRVWASCRVTSRSDVGRGVSSRRNPSNSHRIRTENPGHLDLVAADVRVRCCSQCRAVEVAPQVLRRGFRLEPDIAEIPATNGLLADEVAHGGAWPPLVEECSHADDVVREVAERIVRETTLLPVDKREADGCSGSMFHGARSP